MVEEDAWYDFNLLKFLKTCDLTCDLFWKMFPVHLIRMYILLLLSESFYIYVRSVLFRSIASLLIFYLDVLSTIESGVLKSSPINIIELLSVFPFRSVYVCCI